MDLHAKAALAATAIIGLAGAASAQTPPPGGWCGGRLADLSPERAKALGVPGGAVLTGFNPGSPCNKAGLKANDVVLQVGETPVTKQDDLRAVLTAHKPGDRVKVRYLDVDGGRVERTLEVLLGVRPVEPAAPAPGR